MSTVDLATVPQAAGVRNSLMHAVRAHAAERPNAIAVCVERDGIEWSYAALVAHVERLALQLRALGMQPGDTVLAHLETDWELLALLLASSINGNVFAPLSPDMPAATLRHIQRETGAKLLLHGATAPEGAFRTIARPWTQLCASDPADVILPDAAEASANALLMIYTSGTTGMPKGVVLSELNLVTMADTLVTTYGIGPADRMMCVMPMHHMNGLMITGLTPLTGGAATVISDRFRFQAARNYLQKVATHRTTVLSVIPSIMAVLTRISPPLDLSAQGVRLALCGTAPLPATLWQQFERQFHVPVHQGYGLTETTTWATMTLPDQPTNYGSVGVPVNCEVRIDTKTPGTPGEVLIRGPIVLLRYQGRKSPLDRGWFRTGDLGYFDEDGQLIISGRIKDTIIRYGMNVHPAEIDPVLLKYAPIAECATIGLPDNIAGETVHTAFVAQAGVTIPSDRELRDWLAQHIAKSALPDRFHEMNRLPVNEIGKVDRRKLKELFTGEVTARILAALNTRKWLRYKLDDVTAVAAAMQSALTRYAPIPMLKYWGAGRKTKLDDVDRAALDRLRALMNQVEEFYEPGVDITLLFTDMHYRINGFAPELTDAYIGSIATYCDDLNIRTLRGSHLWAEAGLTLEAALARANSPEGLQEWAELSVRDELISQAGKRAIADGDIEQIARVYLSANMLEREVYTARYPDHIFLTYNRDSQGWLLPDLPLLFIHSHRQYASDKPWFVDAAAEALEAQSTSS